MTNSIGEIVNADVIFITGSNTTENHPVIGSKVRQAIKNGAKLIVADPRDIPLAKDAEIFLKIKPGTNIALSNAMINVIIEEGLADMPFIESNTQGFDDILTVIKDYPPRIAAGICGIDADDIIRAARLYASSKKSSILYCMGITQHHNGTDTVISLSNLALITGNIGRESSGLNPLRGQNNVQGACDMGALPDVYTGYQSVKDPLYKDKFEKAWNAKLSNLQGLTITEAMQKSALGEIAVLYIMGENPMVSDPDTAHVVKALSKSFVIVQDIFLTETAALADVVLPASCFAEKDGTFTNTERRVQRVRKAVNPPGQAKSDWEIILGIMNKLGDESKYGSSQEIFEEIRGLTPQYAGISYRRIEKVGIQWPCPNEDHPGTKILHLGRPARGLGLLKAVKFNESAEINSQEYPLLLTTGRILYQYHTRTMTDKTEGILELAPGHYIEINPKLAALKGIKSGDSVKVTSRRGEIITKAVLTEGIGEKVCFMPFHWGEGANVLTNGQTLDEHSKIPGLKITGVRIERVL